MDGAAFRHVFSKLPTGVCVVTVGSGCARHGVTLGTVSALSLAPPLLMFALQERSGLLRRLQPGVGLAVNVLGADQEQLARAFARPGADRFSHGRWREHDGLPLLVGAAAWLVATVDALVRLGDHVLVTGAIRHGGTTAARALVYAEREYATSCTTARADCDG